MLYSKTKFKTIVLFLTLLCFLNFEVIAQSQSPNATAMAESNSISGPYTGRPDITIPLLILKGREVSLPISLTYNSIGVRVEEVGSMVGIGWNLSAGGAITRTVRGSEDFLNTTKGYVNPTMKLPISIDNVCNDNSVDYSSYLQDIINLNRDTEPDLYNVSVPGLSTQFFFDQDGNAYSIPRNKLKIDSPGVGGNSWTITTSEGFIYRFGGSVNLIEKSDNVATTWLLKQIETPLGEIVDFYYNSYTLSYELNPFETAVFELGSNVCIGEEDQIYTGDRKVNIASKYIERIELNKSIVKFHTGLRCDITGGEKLESIIWTENDKKIKQINFGYSCNEVNQRLWLKSIREIGRNGSSLAPYRFSYKEKEKLPGLKSYAQDHWGFYNGKAINNTLIPSYLSSSENFVFSGADRNPDPNTILYGVLEKVEYPTGGYSTYEFESNSYSNHIEQYPVLEKTDQYYEAGIGQRSTILSPQGSTFSSTTFNLVEPSVVRFNYKVDALGLIPVDDFYVKWEGPGVSTIKSSTGSTVVQLAAGSYTITAMIGTNDPEIFMAEITTSFSALAAELNAPQQRIGGGLRVKKISRYESVSDLNPTISRYEYKDLNISTGKIMSGPVYQYNVREHCTSNVNTYVDYKVLLSASAIPLSTSAAGSYVGYSKVTAYQSVDNSEGETVYEFINEPSTYIISTSVFGNQKIPFAPTQNVDYKNGLPTKTTYYRYYNGSFLEQSNTVYTYNFAEPFSSKGLVIGDQSLISGICNNLFYGFYDVQTAWLQAHQVTQTVFDGDQESIGNSFQTTSTLEYDAAEPWLVRSKFTSNSDGINKKIEYKYPIDYDSNAGSGVIGEMLSRFILTPTIQQLEYSGLPGNEEITGGNIMIYENDNGNILPTSMYALETEQPISSLPFNPSIFLQDSRYKLELLNTYDQDGSLIQTNKEDSYVSLIRSENEKRVLAKVSNAPHSKIAFSGFEEILQGGWVYNQSNVVNSTAYTGKKAFSGTVNSATLLSDNYVVSMWAKGSGSVSVNGISKPSNGADWQYLEWQINNTTSIAINSGSVLIDELRLYPVGALMSTTTYNPGIGVTSSTQTDGKASFFEYDEFNRLKLIRDFESDIVNIREYNMGSVLYGDIISSVPNLNIASSWRVDVSKEMPSGVNYSWNFRDGSPLVTGQQVSHAFSKLGFYDIELTLSKAGYEDATERKVIKVEGELNAQINLTGLIEPNKVIGINVSAIDSNPDFTKYNWKNNSVVAGKGENIEVVYSTLGEETVEVTVSHKDYIAKKFTTSFWLTGELNPAWTMPTGIIYEGVNNDYVATTINSINKANTVYTWNFNGVTNIGSNVSYAFPAAGTYNTTLTVSDPDLHYSDKFLTKSIVVAYSNPQINLITIPGGDDITVDVAYAEPNFEFIFEEETSDVVTYPSGWKPLHTYLAKTPIRSYTYTTNFSQNTQVRVHVIDASGRDSGYSTVTIFKNI